MGEEILVEAKIADAKILVKKLDELGESPSFAAWCYFDDAERWRLLICSVEIDRLLAEGKAVTYRHVLEIVYALDLTSMSASDVQVVRSDSKWPVLFGAAVRIEPPKIGNASFFDSTFSGAFVKAVIILRSDGPGPKKGKSPRPSKSKPRASKTA